MRPEPVAISGFGCISAIGNCVAEMRMSLMEGACGIGPVDFELAPSGRIGIAAQIRGFELADHFPAQLLPTIDRFTGLALHATEQAVEMSGLAESDLAGPRVAAVVGSGIGGQTTLDAAIRTVLANQPGPADPFIVPKLMANAAASNISMRYGCRGPTITVSTACSSGAQSIGLAFEMVRSGAVDVAIAGGAEAMVTPYSLRIWEALKVLSPNVCRPFSRKRNGMVLGEGAGIFILERRSDVLARGGTVLAELAGYGTSSDAVDLLRPDPHGAALAMSLALESAGLAPEAVDYVNAHGTGTLANDINETAALKDVFASHADRLAVSSTKSMHGHAIGAAGAIELAATLIALQEQVAPPTVNWIERDPKCDLDYVPNAARPMRIDVAMSNSFAFGGINASLVVTRGSSHELRANGT